MKKLIFSLIAALIFVSVTPNVASAQNPNTQIEYFSDGSYLITYVTETTNFSNIATYAATTKTKTKTANYYNSSNELLWFVQVKGTFTYGNGSSKCTASEVNAGSYNSHWKLSNKTSSKSGNSATASVTAKLYRGSEVLQTLHKSVTLSCSPTGQFS